MEQAAERVAGGKFFRHAVIFCLVVEGIMSQANILIVEDEEGIVSELKYRLEEFGYAVVGATAHGEEAVSLAERLRPDLVLMDIQLKGEMDGIEAARQIQQANRLPIVFLTAYGDDATLNRAKTVESSGYILKPVEERNLQSTIQMALFKQRAEHRLRDSQERLSLALSASRMGVWERDMETGSMFWSRECASILGVEGNIGTTEEFTRTLHAADKSRLTEAIHQAAASKSNFSVEFRVTHSNGDVHWICGLGRMLSSSDGMPPRMIGTIQDITERQTLQLQLQQAQKLESVGRLAAGIAHEINTPTQFIGDNLRFLQDGFGNLDPLLQLQPRLLGVLRGTPLGEELEDAIRDADLEYYTNEIPSAIEQSLEGVQRVARIVFAMKEFSHPVVSEKTPSNLNNLVESTLTVSRNEWKYVADAVTQFDPTLPLVDCNAGEFNQVVLNLIVNAAHAISDATNEGTKGKGMITVRTCTNNPWAEVRISDTGIGIPSDLHDRIFDPFFTSKAVGKGTGQGLAIARNIIVEKHGGELTFESVVGEGTTFIIRLPLGTPTEVPTMEIENETHTVR